MKVFVKTAIGELMPTTAHKRHERAGTEVEHVPDGREHLRLIIAQRSQVSADREAGRDLRSRYSPSFG